jgi:ATP-dependent protease HslVU (ClpYQ) peptidase subunit
MPEGSALVLDKKSLTVYSYGVSGELISSGVEAIGSGGKSAMCAYDALGRQNPSKAVRIVCKHDSGSCCPIRVYKLTP